MDASTLDWNDLLLDQLEWHWREQLRPRLDGLDDREYVWEPVPGSWNLRPRGRERTGIGAGSGPWVVEYEVPEPVPAPVTTIAWRLAHLVVAVLGERNASHFGGPATSYREHDHAGSAVEALGQLDAAHDRWVAGVAALGADGLARPCGPAEGPFAEYPLAALVLHTHREVIHHGAEIALLRDLYARRGQDVERS